MKKFLQKTIIFIVLWMILLNSIVPTRVVWAVIVPVKAGESEEESYFRDVVTAGEIENLTNPNFGNSVDFQSFTVPNDAVYGFTQNSSAVGGAGELHIFAKNENGQLQEVPYESYTYEDGTKYYGAELQAGTSYYIWEEQFNELQKNPIPVYLLDPAMKDETNTASLIERLLTILFLTIGDGAMWAIGAVVGDSISMDALFFNDYPSTRLSFFVGEPDADIQEPNPFLESGDVLTTIGNIFDTFRVIAIGIYVVMLLYMGIRILLSSTGREKSKYKDLAMYWLKGVAILYLFPYVMKYTILLNDALVNYIKTVKSKVQMEQIQIDTYPGGLSFPLEFGGISVKARTDYMSYLRQMAQDTGRLAYAICWLILIIDLIKFFMIYFKRLLITLFLIAVFPLVTISYAIDKIGDGKSQAFDNWFKEFALNVFLQTFHALNYTVIMGLIFKIGSGGETVNYVLILVAITYITRGEQILRGIFGQDKGVGTVKSAMDSIVKTATIKSLISGTRRTIKNKKKAITSFVDRGRGISDNMMRNAESRLLEKNKNLDLRGALPVVSRKAENDIKENISIAVSETASPQDVRNAALKLFQYSINPETKGELEKQIRLRPDSVELQAMIKEYEALAEIEQNLEINLNTNLNFLVKRKGSRSLQSRKLLQAYGYTEKNLEDMHKKLMTDKAAYQKLRTLNQKRIRTGEKESSKPKTISVVEARVLSGDVGSKKSKGFSRAKAKAKSEGKTLTLRRKGTRQGKLVGKKLPRDSRNAYRLNQNVNGKRLKLTRGESIKTKQEKWVGKKLPRDSRNRNQLKQEATAQEKNRNNMKNPIHAAQKEDPLRKTYTDTTKEVVGQRRTTAEKERVKRRVEEQRKREVLEKREKEAVRITEVAVTARDSRPITFAERAQYETAAKNVEIMTNAETTLAEKVQAKQDFDDVAMQIRLAQGIGVQDKGIIAMQNEVPKDITDSFDHIEAMKNDAVEAHGKDLMTPELAKTYSDLAINVETLSRGDETLSDLWKTFDQVESVSSSHDDGIKLIQEKLGFTLEEYRTNLAVETLNHISELQGTEREKQKIIDRAIETVKDHQYQKGLYGQILSGLQFDIHQLQKGQVPVLTKETQKPKAPTETREAREIKKALREKQKKERESIYYVDDSYDRKAESKKIRKEVIRLGKDIAKDTAESTASVVGGILGAATYMGVEDQYDVAKIAAATSLGSTATSVVESRVVDFAESAVDETSKLAKRFGKALKDNRKNGNPITMYDDNGRPIRS